MISFQLNGEDTQVEVDAAKPILWVLREDLKKIGAKFAKVFQTTSSARAIYCVSSSRICCDISANSNALAI